MRHLTHVRILLASAMVMLAACGANFRGPDYEIDQAPSPAALWIDACGAGKDITVQATTATYDALIQPNVPTDNLDFEFFGARPAARLTVASEGFIQLSGETVPADYQDYELLPNAIFVNSDYIPNSSDCEGVPCNQVCYAMTGTAPERTLVVEWKNVHRTASDIQYGQYNGQDTAHYQVQLHETSNVIDFLYRELPRGKSPYATVGIVNGDKSVGHFFCAHENASKGLVGGTVLNETSPADCPLKENTQFRFAPVP